MALTCEHCGSEVLESDVKCPSCGTTQSSTGVRQLIGKVLLGQYQITGILGQGGMSVVYKGRHRLTDQEVALKVLPPELAALSQVKSRFVEEAKALAQLDHPNIVHLYNFGEENGCFVLAMQYVHGCTFERMILDAEKLDWTIACEVTTDVLRALEYAHSRGIIHRDMKPSNILVRELDGSATVMDFGIAKMTTSTRLTATGQTMGTVRYMSPEQVRGHKVDGRTDIYSLGVTLYEAVCGDTPFDGETHFEIMSKQLHEPPRAPSVLGIDVPQEFEIALMKAIAKKPEQRFQSAREFRKELEALLHDPDGTRTQMMRMTRHLLSLDARPGGPPPESDVIARTSDLLATGGTQPAPEIKDSSAPPAASSVEAPQAKGPEAQKQAKAPEAQTQAKTSAPAGSSAPGSTLWIAGAGAILLAGAAAALLLLRSDPQTSAVAAQESPGKAETSAAPQWPSPFLPPGIQFEIDQSYPEDALRVLAIKGWDAERVHAAYLQGNRLFREFLQKRGLAENPGSLPLNIAIVPQQVFCDPLTYEQQSPDEACQDLGVYMRLKERTLLVVSEKDELDRNIAYGTAQAICFTMANEACDRLAVEFDREFDRVLKSEQGRKKER